MTAARHHAVLALGAVLALAGLGGRASATGGLPGAKPAIGERGAVNVAPAELDGVEVTERLGTTLPLDTVLRDETGAPLRLGELFGDGLPVLVTFNYSTCPMLCSEMLGGLVARLRELEWSAGLQFRIVTIGLDPLETHVRAMESKMRYLARYERDSAEDGWRFLTGTPAAVRAIADAAGFGYRLSPATGEVFHPAVLVFVSSEGVVSRYVYGTRFDAGELRTALTATALGKITESTGKFLHACFFSNEPPRGFAAIALKSMRIGGFVFVLGLAGVFAILGLIRSSRSSRAPKGHGRRSSRAPESGRAGSH